MMPPRPTPLTVSFMTLRVGKAARVKSENLTLDWFVCILPTAAKTCGRRLNRLCRNSAYDRPLRLPPCAGDIGATAQPTRREPGRG